jgi:hypothetical protein
VTQHKDLKLNCIYLQEDGISWKEGSWKSIEIKIKANIVNNPTGIHPPFDDAIIVLNKSSHCSHFQLQLAGSSPHSPIIIQNG